MTDITIEDMPHRLRRARGFLALNQVELADAIGLTTDTISAYEVGRRTIPSLVLVGVVGVAFLRRGPVDATTVAHVLGLPQPSLEATS